MEIRFHKQVQTDLNESLGYYYKVSPELEDGFYKEFKLGVQKVLDNPLRYPFDLKNLRPGAWHRSVETPLWVWRWISIPMMMPPNM